VGEIFLLIFANMIKNINIKKGKFIGQYVRLRNKYVGELMTHKVTIAGTLRWFANTDVEIYGITENEDLLGVVLIYIEKGNEIAFFVKKSGQGIGTRLLKIADRIAKKRQLTQLWAWTKVENIMAKRCFEKNGYIKQKRETREYQGEKIEGHHFVKNFI